MNCLTIDFTLVQPVLILQLIILGVILGCYFLDRRKRKEEIEQLMKMKSELYQMKINKEQL